MAKSGKTDRRSFIKSTGAVVIGSSIGLNLAFPLQGLSKGNDVLKVGLIGCGGRGTGAASQALKADPNVILTAMADVFQDRLDQSYDILLKAVPDKVQVPKENRFVGFDAYQRLIDSGVDVVLLTTPPAFRPEQLTAAVNAGKHIFCEKPVAVDAPGVRKVLAAAKKAKEKGLSLVSGFTFRYDLPKRELFGRVQNGEIGEVKMVNSTRNGGGLWNFERKPEWIKTRANMGPEYTRLRSLVKSEGLHTVCQEAACPNIFECWEDKEATFLIGGDRCTRRCDFCNIDTGKPLPIDREEPRKVAESVKAMGLRYATITGVTRDDLPDEGAWLYAETIRQVHELNPGCGVEMLAPDFHAKGELLNQIFETKPEVFAHNLETVPRIFKRIRPAFTYEKSLQVIGMARDFGLVTKSNLILGLGETREEISQALVDLHSAGCDLITITQYLRPTNKHHPVERWVKPEEFVELATEATEVGFLGVMSGPLVRSSYRAGRLYKQAVEARASKGSLHG
jgi:lipoic acid synthetase